MSKNGSFFGDCCLLIYFDVLWNSELLGKADRVEGLMNLSDHSDYICV